jgi:hypothetical protein
MHIILFLVSFVLVNLSYYEYSCCDKYMTHKNRRSTIFSMYTFLGITVTCKSGSSSSNLPQAWEFFWGRGIERLLETHVNWC